MSPWQRRLFVLGMLIAVPLTATVIGIVLQRVFAAPILTLLGPLFCLACALFLVKRIDRL